ncbi:MAG: methylated-DNA--[protein]-cysteine S-methyltransferase [Conexibacteraceae bacterium]|nr:methylated-DNA--[protein]-cysteine S-methyltransferase [Conexibacteraceae bacterium]
MIELPDLTDAFAAAGLIDVAYAIEPTPVGRLLLATTPRGLVRVAYLDADDDEDRALAELAERISPRVLAAPGRLDAPRRELDEFFAGRRRSFETPLDWRMTHTGFAQRVLRATKRIPFGETSSYQQVASRAGSPRAYRAAGNALGANPLPIVVPCHRVLHAGGGLGGYTGGLERKQALLALEGVIS